MSIYKDFNGFNSCSKSLCGWTQLKKKNNNMELPNKFGTEMFYQ